jgi:hypothetical protein
MVANAASNLSAWTTVRGKPSRMKDGPWESIHEETIRTIRSSGTRRPRDVQESASAPSGVPPADSARRSAPVETWGTPKLDASAEAWVPLPEAGGPRRRILLFKE